MCDNCPAAYNAYRLADVVDEIVPSGWIMVGDWQRRAPGCKGRFEERAIMHSKGVASAKACAFLVGRIRSGRCS
jgi:hypothetical protein